MNQQLHFGMALVLLVLCTGCEMSDSREKRIAASKYVDGLAARLRANPNDADAFQKLEQAANSHYRFERSRAVGTLGDLGKMSLPALPTMQKALLSLDPYVRDSAAFAIAEMGTDARPATPELVTFLHRHYNEGGSRHVVRVLQEIGDPRPEVVEALQFAARVDDSYAAEEAKAALEALLAGKERQRKGDAAGAPE